MIRKVNILKSSTNGRGVCTFGIPPELTGDKDNRLLMPPARVLVIEQDEHGSFMLWRFAEDGQDAGDTWHQSEDDGLHQAQFEFGSELGEWRDVSEDPCEMNALVMRELQGIK